METKKSRFTEPFPVVCFVIYSVLFVGCVDEVSGRKILAAEGYTDVIFSGHGDNCHGDDSTCTAFIAMTSAGHQVHLMVGCTAAGCGPKNCTVRIQP